MPFITFVLTLYKLFGFCAFNQKPAGRGEGNEWVTIHNPSNKSVDIGNRTLETTNDSTVSVWIAEGTTLYPGAYITFSPSYRWLDNSEEAIILRNEPLESSTTMP
jgi:hypothetical protein